MSDDVEITGLAHGGDGIARIDGEVCFVPYGLPGDRVRVEVEGRRQGVSRGRIVELLDPSPDRVEAGCPVFGRCGGCTWLHFAYPAQGEWKRRIVGDCFERIGKLEVEVGWLEDPELRTGYRTRATFRCENGAAGFYEAGSHALVGIESCPLCHPKLNAVLGKLRGMNFPVPVEVTVNPEGEEVLVWTKTPQAKLGRAFENAGSPKDEQPRAHFLFDGVQIVNGAFSQSSLLLNRMLVNAVQEAIGPASSLLDLYCGNGNFSSALCERMRVLGLDRARVSIDAAKAVCRGDYLVRDESRFVKMMKRDGWDVMLLDPPRQGAKQIAGPLGASRADTIVYVSCNPATLARDAGAIVAGGWRVARVTCVDMFPHTAHIETLCVFERR